jgi:arylsulfatase A-like enzyme
MHRHTLLISSILATILLITPNAYGSEQKTKRPNVVFIMTDDQDAQMNSLDYMPAVQKHLMQKGTHYQKHYCTVAWCCPSRVSLWTGKTAHNTNVTNVEPPYGTFH